MRRTPPVKFWAFIGCAMWLFQTYVLLRWVTGPGFEEIGPGPVDPPTSMKTAIVIYLCVQWTLFFVFGYRWVIKPIREERRLSFDGILFLVWCAWYWFWDPFGNYLSVTYSYNAWVPNMGSWVSEIPGWNSPPVPEPWLFTAGAYGLFIVGGSMLGCAVMRALRRRWPRMGTLGLVLWTYALFVVLATLLELTWMRIGLYTYLATPADLPVFFPSHYYKYPAAEGLWFGAMITSMVYLRWSMNDKGETIAERGATDLRIAKGPLTGLRLLAIAGFVNVIVFCVFYIPYLLVWSPHPEKVPMDIQKRSYLMNGLCGPETPRACPDESIPLWREKSITFGPDGKLYIPPGVKPPDGPTTFDEAARRDAQP